MGRNSERRRARLATGYRESIDNEPSPEDRRFETERSLLEGPNETVRVFWTSGIVGSARFAGRPGPNGIRVPQRHTWSNVTMRGGSIILGKCNLPVRRAFCAVASCNQRDASRMLANNIRSLRLCAEGGNGRTFHLLHFVRRGCRHPLR